MTIFTSSCMLPDPLWAWLYLSDLCLMEKIRSHQNETPSSSNHIDKPTCTCFHILTCPFSLWSDLIPPWLLNITSVFITIYLCSQLFLFHQQKHMPYHLPFSIPLTPTYLLWLHVYAHLYNKQKSPCVSWLQTPSFLNPLQPDFLPQHSRAYVNLQTKVKRRLWESSRWSGEGKGGARSGSLCETTLVIEVEAESPMPGYSPNPHRGLTPGQSWALWHSRSTCYLQEQVSERGKGGKRVFPTFGGWLKKSDVKNEESTLL